MQVYNIPRLPFATVPNHRTVIKSSFFSLFFGRGLKGETLSFLVKRKVSP